MTLKELQQMIKEEFDAFRNEADDEVDVSVSDADVDVDAEMGDEMAPEGEEDVLRKIYDLLDAHFNPVEDEMGDEDFGAPEDIEGGEAPEADLEEGDGYDGKTTGSTKNAPYSGKLKGSTKNAPYTASSKSLQERFQKLANIIK